MPQTTALNNFFFVAIDLRYSASKLSEAALEKIIVLHQAPDIWHSCKNVDLGKLYNINSLKKHEEVSQDPEKRNAILTTYMKKNGTK